MPSPHSRGSCSKVRFLMAGQFPLYPFFSHDLSISVGLSLHSVRYGFIFFTSAMFLRISHQSLTSGAVDSVRSSRTPFLEINVSSSFAVCSRVLASKVAEYYLLHFVERQWISAVWKLVVRRSDREWRISPTAASSPQKRFCFPVGKLGQC